MRKVIWEKKFHFCFLFDYSFREFKAARDIPVLGSMRQVINSDRTPWTFHAETRNFPALKQEPLHHSVEFNFLWAVLEYINILNFLCWGIFIFPTTNLKINTAPGLWFLVRKYKQWLERCIGRASHLIYQ